MYCPNRNSPRVRAVARPDTTPVQELTSNARLRDVGTDDECSAGKPSLRSLALLGSSYKAVDVLDIDTRPVGANSFAKRPV